MFNEVTPYDAPALLGIHSTLSPDALLDRLLAPPASPPRRGLSGYLTRGLIEWACETNAWNAPAQRRFPLEGSVPPASIAIPATFAQHGIACVASAWTTTDETGAHISLTAAHIPGFTYSREWGKSGLVPEVFAIQAQWIMGLAGTRIHGFVVLADKSATIHWVDRDDTIINRLGAALSQMAAHITAGTRPAIDQAFAENTLAPSSQEDAADSTPEARDAATARWLAAREANAAAATKAAATANEYDAASTALKALIPPGGHHDHAGLRIHHNARTGRLTEDKIDVAFF